jgi:putative transport protein
MQTQPAVLAYCAEQLEDERELTLGYASVYPLAMISKIVLAQIVTSLLT